MVQARGSQGRLWTGLILIALGVLFLLDEMLIIDFDFGRFFSTWWPSIFIVMGLASLAKHRYRYWSGPLLLIAFGVFLQVSRLHIFSWWRVRSLWPAILILLGLWMLIGRLRPRGVSVDSNLSSNTGVRQESGELVDAFVIFGGLESAANSKQFRGGEATAILGGINLDLRSAALAPGENRLNLTALFGGINLHVPENWEVVVEGTPLLGSIEDARKTFAQPASPDAVLAPRAGAEAAAVGGRLLVHGFAMFGGIEVK